MGLLRMLWQKTFKKEEPNIIEPRKQSIRDLIEEVEALSYSEELEEELIAYKPISSLSERDKKVLILLWKHNGLTVKQLHALILGDIKHLTNVYKVTQRLVNKGHVWKMGNMYFSKYKFGPRKNKGFVYVLKEFHTNTFKIGKTKNLENRLGFFSVKLPFGWELVTSIQFKDYVYGERLMHKAFDEKRIGDIGIGTNRVGNTEWFALSKDDLRMIKEQNLPKEITNLICG